MIETRVDSRQVDRYLSSILARGKRIPLRRLATIGLRSVLRNFNEQGRPDKWAPLALKPNGEPRREGMILQDKGRLKKSIDWEGFASGTNLKVYTDLVYAPPHQYGWPEKHIPARPFMMWQPEDIKDMQKVLADHLEGKGRG